MAITVRPIRPCPRGYFGPWAAPAKLNLMLNIVGRRADGYHELQTVFHLLAWGDWLYLRPRQDGCIRAVRPLPGVPAQDNLCVRAATLLRATAGQAHWGADIYLRKQIPLGGGLGGGSSDAATVLLGLNRLWGLNYDLPTLAQLGLQLGADVPVFIGGRSAWAEGVGEVLTPIILPAHWYLLITPPCTVATATIFRDPELTRNAPRRTIAAFFTGDCVNLCTPVVRKHAPIVAQVMDTLDRYAPARLTGTGASVFATFVRQAEAQAVQAQLPATWRSQVVQGVSRSCLHTQLGYEA